MEKKGRPPASTVRDNLIDMLFVMKEAHGYDISKHYNKLFPKVTQRLIYYHLRKAQDYGLIELKRVDKKEGNYSWGSTVERLMYSLTKKAKPNLKKEIKDYFDKVYKEK